MNIGATVVTSSSEMIRGLVRVTRSASNDGSRRLLRRLSVAGAGVRAEWNASTTSAAQSRAPTSRWAARRPGGSRLSTIAAPTPIWSSGDRQHDRRDRPSSCSAGSGRAPSRDSQRQHQAQESEGEHPVSPMQGRQGLGRWQHCAVAEREPEAEQAGMKIGDLGPEQDDHETRAPRRPIRGDVLRCRVDSAVRGPPAPARSAVTMSTASSTIAFARWVITTQGGSASLTVTAPSNT